MRRRGLERLLERHALHARVVALQQFVRPLLHDVGDVGVGRAAVGRVVFESAVCRRIVRRRDDDAVGEAVVPAAIVRQDRVRDDRRRREAVVSWMIAFYAVGRQHFEGRLLRRPRKARACPCRDRAGR